eukprot:gene11300-11450_t
MAEADLQALAELKDKMDIGVAVAAQVQSQLQRAKINKRRSELTLQELSQIPDSVPMYKQVGKAYFLAPMQQLVGDLQDDIKIMEDEAKRLAQQLQHAEKSISATEGELKELIQSHPELRKQIATAM